MKPRYMVWLECLALILVGAIAPTIDVLTSDAVWSDLGKPSIVMAMVLGGANAMKAFFSTAAEQLRKEKP